MNILGIKNVSCNYGGDPSRIGISGCLTVPEFEVGPRYWGVGSGVVPDTHPL